MSNPALLQRQRELLRAFRQAVPLRATQEEAAAAQHALAINQAGTAFQGSQQQATAQHDQDSTINQQRYDADQHAANEALAQQQAAAEAQIQHFRTAAQAKQARDRQTAADALNEQTHTADMWLAHDTAAINDRYEADARSAAVDLAQAQQSAQTDLHALTRMLELARVYLQQAALKLPTTIEPVDERGIMAETARDLLTQSRAEAETIILSLEQAAQDLRRRRASMRLRVRIGLALALILLLLGLASFASSQYRTYQQEQQAQANATAVAEAIEAARRQATAIAEATSVAIAQMTATAEAASRQATAEAGATATAVAEATATREAQLQATAATLATLPEPLQRALQWPVVFADDFSTDEHWFTGESSSDRATTNRRIENGVYHWDMQAHQDVIGRTGPADSPSLTTFYATVQARQMSGPVAKGYGFVSRRHSDPTRYYWFETADDQTFRFGRYNDGDLEDLIDWTDSSAIQPGEWNRLAVIGEGAHFTFLINDQQVAAYDDDRLADGEVELAVYLPADSEGSWEFDTFEIRAP